MKHITGITILFLLSAIFSCTAPTSSIVSDTTKTNDELNRAYWLLGSWQQTVPHGIMTEHWEKQNDSLYTGESYIIEGRDTTLLETICLKQKGDILYYIATVKDQNNGLPIEFKLTASSPTQLTFENPAHNEPYKITYTLITADSLLAEISGNSDGKIETMQFSMKKIK